MFLLIFIHSIYSYSCIKILGVGRFKVFFFQFLSKKKIIIYCYKNINTHLIKYLYWKFYMKKMNLKLHIYEKRNKIVILTYEYKEESFDVTFISWFGKTVGFDRVKERKKTGGCCAIILITARLKSETFPPSHFSHLRINSSLYVFFLFLTFFA